MNQRKSEKCAFNYLLAQKNKHTKINEVDYVTLEIQPYMKNKYFTNKEVSLLYSLRSKCYQAKANFKNMHSNNLLCTFGCNVLEDQRHIFTECQSLLLNIILPENTHYIHIFGDVVKQKEVIKLFLEIEDVRRTKLDNLLPGGDYAGTHDLSDLS